MNDCVCHLSLVQCHNRLCVNYPGLGVHRNDCNGLENTKARIVTDGCAAIFEMFAPLRSLTAAKCPVKVLCLKSFVDIHGFYTFVHKKLHQPHTVSNAQTTTVACHLD